MIAETLADVRCAPRALRVQLTSSSAASHPRLACLLAEAVDHLEDIVRTRPAEAVGAIAVPVAVHRALADNPIPQGILASAAATYLALDVLDDQMDGDQPAFWSGRRPSEVVLGAQMLLLAGAAAVRPGYLAMITAVFEGQLRTEVPLSTTTSPAAVAATISARSGAMLAGFAEAAAVAAGGSPEEIAAARQFGHELGVARQHVNDLTELVGDRTTDLRNGTATMTVALALQRLGESGRARLLEKLRRSVSDVTVRDGLLSDDLAQAIQESAVLITLHLDQARAAARFLRRTNMRDDGLDQLIEFTTIRGWTPSS